MDIISLLLKARNDVCPLISFELKAKFLSQNLKCHPKLGLILVKIFSLKMFP